MNYPQGPQYGQQPQKKGMSTLTIVLIVLGVLAVLFLGTCGVAALFINHEVKEVQKSFAEGGIVLVSPPEVTQALAGPKKDYVGFWKSKSGKSTMNIDALGNLKMDVAETGAHEVTEAPIAAFVGDDMDVKIMMDLRIKVPEAPHKVGDQWQMRVRDITFQR